MKIKQQLRWLKDRAKRTDGMGRSLLVGAASLGVAGVVLDFASGFMAGGSVALVATWYLRERAKERKLDGQG